MVDGNMVEPLDCQNSRRHAETRCRNAEEGNVGAEAQRPPRNILGPPSLGISPKASQNRKMETWNPR